jgi:hypothetical protein
LSVGKTAPCAAQLFHSKFKIHNSKLELLVPPFLLYRLISEDAMLFIKKVSTFFWLLAKIVI